MFFTTGHNRPGERPQWSLASLPAISADTPRVAQVRGMFDLVPESTSRVAWDVDLPLEDHPWHIGLIVGPSGCGKSTIARSLWPRACGISSNMEWPASQSVLDAFPPTLPIKEVVATLSAVGFSSPPAWLRPFRVLSTGQQFRVTLARLLAEGSSATSLREPLVCDEFTSVVDRTVAQVGSAAVSKAIRARGLQFIAVTCHEDVEPWLNPDWVYRPAERQFVWRLLQRRPPVHLSLARSGAAAWRCYSHRITI